MSHSKKQFLKLSRIDSGAIRSRNEFGTLVWNEEAHITDEEIEQQVTKEGSHNWDCQCGVHLWNEVRRAARRID